MKVVEPGPVNACCSALRPIHTKMKFYEQQKNVKFCYCQIFVSHVCNLLDFCVAANASCMLLIRLLKSSFPASCFRNDCASSRDWRRRIAKSFFASSSSTSTYNHACFQWNWKIENMSRQFLVVTFWISTFWFCFFNFGFVFCSCMCG